MATVDVIEIGRWVADRLAVLDPPADWDPNTARGLVEVRNRRRATAGSRRGWVWLAASTAMVSLLLMPTSNLRGFAHACREFIRRSLPDTGSTRSYTAATQRIPLADRQLSDVRGEHVSLSEYRGKVVLVTYWTTTCGQCQSEMSWFSEFQRKFGTLDFAVIGVSVDQGGAAAVHRYLSTRPVDYRVVIGDQDTAQVHAATSIPTTFILDRSGRIAVRHVGYCSKREFESDIRTILAER